MHPTHRERLSQVSAESGLDFIAHLDDDIARTSVSANQSQLPYYQPLQSQIHKPHNLDHYPSATSAPATTTPPPPPPPQGTTNLDLDGIDQILSRHGLLRPGDILDLHGPTGSGKTHFLYAIIISTILPKFWRHSKSYPAIPLLGKARSVVFFDLDQGFDVTRMKDLLCLQIKYRVRQFLDSTNNKDGNNDVTDSNTTSGGDTSSTTTSGTKEIDIELPTFLAKIDQLAISCLRNVHIFRPQDTISTIVLLRTLETYLLQQTNITTPPSLSTTTSQLQSQFHQQQQQQQPSPPFAFLILDSLSTFYWQDRAQTNHTRIMSLLYDSLQRLVTRWGLIFITTSWLLDSSSSSSSNATSAFANIADRTIPDSFRAKIRFRFLLQPRNLNRFETEQLLLQEWQFRQQQQQRQHGGRQDDAVQNGGKDEGKAVGVLGVGNKHLSHEPDPIDTRPALFQGQMIIPETRHEPYTQPELFRFSISMKDGLFSFCPPPSPSPPIPQTCKEKGTAASITSMVA